MREGSTHTMHVPKPERQWDNVEHRVGDKDDIEVETEAAKHFSEKVPVEAHIGTQVWKGKRAHIHCLHSV